ncbi:MAG: hypothetical protein EOP45_22515 [Sphingobacteriaceae bacterium]|nr:MAG: hypothetical protein EOP45_22515 [Sphingobacteriaceae bacterium]
MEKQRRDIAMAKAKEKEEDRRINRALHRLEVPFREPFQELAFKDARTKEVLDERMKSESDDYKNEVVFWKDEYRGWMKKEGSTLSLQTWAYSDYTSRIADATSST